MSLAIFDLDNTLLAGDSDYLWGQFLVEQGIVDRQRYEQANHHFYQQYREGTLRIEDFLKFALQPLAAHEPDQLYRWRARFLEEKIRPILLPAARRQIEWHRKTGDTLLVITATNQFVTEPIVRLYDIDNLLATTPEFINGRYSGRFTGIPCFQEGKIKRLQAWMEDHGHCLTGSWFYSDSHNDLPLLRQVDHPVAVDPDEQLHHTATAEGWPVTSFRNQPESGN